MLDKAKIARELGLARSVMTGETRIHMEGDARMIIEGHSGLLEYTGESIRVRAKGMLLHIEGEKLMMEALTAEDLILVGKIDKILLLKPEEC
ncbi:MAG: YabP/YqfC family sporulation protein [Christensenellaceae bacterium]|jgi:sporulation protein YqfC|nr:YabP/YqfC family sporulation protein [Christensenellaceae bacterium]